MEEECLRKFIKNQQLLLYFALRIFLKIRELALDRIVRSEINEFFEEEFPPGLSDDESNCSISPSSTLRIIEIANDLFSTTLEHLPPKLLTFFNRKDLAFKRMNSVFLPNVGSISLQLILKAIKRQIDRQAPEENHKNECGMIFAEVLTILKDDSREGKKEIKL